MHTRRTVVAALGAILVQQSLARTDDASLRAAVIGHTGHGDYGHGMDHVFKGLPGVEVVAVADAGGEAALAKAAARSGAPRTYVDWKEMLDKEKPQLVAVGPRHTGERLEMLLGVLNAGAHLISEKPFVRTPADGDKVLALADQKGLKVAVAHRMRIEAGVMHLKKKFDEGLFGDLVHLRAFGKQDRRAGGEDLLVLGVHLFDLMRMFAGDPSWCTARVCQKGRDATIADVKAPTEDIGPILGDEIEAQFAFAKGVTGTFTSRASARDYAGHWGVEIVGTKGVGRILPDTWPSSYVRRATAWNDKGQTDTWELLADDPSLGGVAAQHTMAVGNTRLAEDWLAAIRENREPICSGRNGAKAVEMVMAVWRAALEGKRVAMPLEERGHAPG